MLAAWNPWEAVRNSDVRIVWCELEDGQLGGYCKDGHVIVLDPRQGQAARRSTVGHELVHHERGVVPVDPVLRAREEAAVEQETARRLIPLESLGNALLSADERDWARVAWELWVDEDTLAARLAHLHPSERHYLLRRLAARDNTEGD